MPDDEISNLPSWMKKKGYASGTTGSSGDSPEIPRASSQPSSRPSVAVQKEPETRSQSIVDSYPKYPVSGTVSSYPSSSSSSAEIPFMYKAVLGAAIIIAIISLFFAYSSYTYMSGIKSSLKSVAMDLKNISNDDITFEAKLNYRGRATANIPFTQIFPEKFGIPIHATIPIKARLKAISAQGIPMYVDVDDSIEINQIATVDPSVIKTTQKIVVDTQLTADDGFAEGRVRIKDLYGESFDRIVGKLEALSK